MKASGAIAAVLALSALPSAAATKPAAKAPATHDWAQIVVVTPEGGYRMGSPGARVKLVEYGSLACPHCRHFEETGFKPLVDGYVRLGKVSYEFRNLLISGPDLSISLLTRCAGPGKFFPMSQFVYSTQKQWQDKIAGMSEAEKAALDQMTDQQRIVRYAELGGMAPIAAKFGLTAAQARQCLADTKGQTRLIDMTQAAMDGGINHTPTFLVNGQKTDAATWEDLEPLIRKAIGHG
jgi:protein-disulfide isomerase